MKRALLVGLLAWGLAAPAAVAEMVVQRWGASGRLQHPDTLTYAPAGTAGTVMAFDISALPAGAKVCRARLMFAAGEGFQVAQVKVAPDGKVAAGKALELVGPYHLWFDATEAVAGWVRSGAKTGRLLLTRGSLRDRHRNYLEIAYEGRLKAAKPAQASELKLLCRRGQVLLTWKEIWDIAEGNPEIAWGEMVKKVTTCTPLGLVPKDDEREIRYRLYTHTEPITPKSIAQASLIHEARSGSGYIEEHIARGRVGEQGPTYLKSKQALRRVVLDPGKPLPPGYGFCAHTVRRGGKAYYAVTTCVDGVENTADISAGNTAGPVEQVVAIPEPHLYGDTVTKLRRPEGAEHHQQWYQWWLRKHMTPYPRRYLVVLDYCPQTMAKPAPLVVTRGHAWVPTPEPPTRPSGRRDVVLAPSSDSPNAFWMGLPTRHNNLRDVTQAVWRPWPQMRNEWLINWVKGKFKIDEQQVIGSIGCWGMMEIERADLYAWLHGWGEPEVTKGFQCFGRAGVWGPPGAYAARPKDQNPWYRQDYGRWAREDPARETPFFVMHTGWGAHFTEMGWPPFPRFYRAMIDAKRPFVSFWRAKHRPTIRRDQSVPAFGNCSLDGNPGNGDLRNGETFGAQINGYLTWDSESIVDKPDRWEMTVILDDSAPLNVCTVDLTPRKCQRFKPKPGRKFRWTCTAAPAGKPKQGKPGEAPTGKPAGGKVLGTGATQADKYGLVTIRQMPMVKGHQRVVIVGQ